MAAPSWPALPREDGSTQRGLTPQGQQIVCVTIDWPEGRAGVFGQNNGQPSADSWFGSAVSGHQDGSGLLYRLNRYYDPKTGRFTQEDPIRLAGGRNLYAFAAGDPVNFADPLGLKICFTSGKATVEEQKADILRQKQEVERMSGTSNETRVTLQNDGYLAECIAKVTATNGQWTLLGRIIERVAGNTAKTVGIIEIAADIKAVSRFQGYGNGYGELFIALAPSGLDSMRSNSESGSGAHHGWGPAKCQGHAGRDASASTAAWGTRERQQPVTRSADQR